VGLAHHDNAARRRSTVTAVLTDDPDVELGESEEDLAAQLFAQ
jgi:hypothetical protein